MAVVPAGLPTREREGEGTSRWGPPKINNGSITECRAITSGSSIKLNAGGVVWGTGYWPAALAAAQHAPRFVFGIFVGDFQVFLGTSLIPLRLLIYCTHFFSYAGKFFSMFHWHWATCTYNKIHVIVPRGPCIAYDLTRLEARTTRKNRDHDLHVMFFNRWSYCRINGWRLL